jgi:site-specific DNA-methyltransferase (adenine-specific)
VGGSDQPGKKIRSDMSVSEVFNEDCMVGMIRYPDKFFDLAIVDPPYGIGISKNPVRQMHEKKDWDSAIPSGEYFNELKRVSKNQIIWGGNYFPLEPSQGFLIWDKKQPHDFSLAMCEFAWMSFQRPAKMFVWSIQKEQDKIHPTQKPVQLYKWMLTNYAQLGEKILDTHMGSQSSRIAAFNMGFDYYGFEIDKEYFEAGNKRFKEQTAQIKMF